MATLLITVGSTLFPSLTDYFLSPKTLAQLPSYGISSLVVQYGKAALPPDCPLLAFVDAKGQGQTTLSGGGRVTTNANVNGKVNASSFTGHFKVTVLRYTSDFAALVRSADCVVSHAGGSFSSSSSYSPPTSPCHTNSAALHESLRVQLTPRLWLDPHHPPIRQAPPRSAQYIAHG